MVTADKSLPCNAEAEEALLGSLLIYGDAMSIVATIVRADDFYFERNRLVFAAQLDLYNRREPVDLLLVSDELSRSQKLEDVGGMAYLASLATSVPSAAYVEHYARLVERSSLMRRLIGAAGQIAAIGFSEPSLAEEAIDKANEVLFAVGKRRAAHDFVHVAEPLRLFHDKLGYLRENRDELSGLATGFHDLDRLTRGLQPSDLIVVAGRPGVGKTSFALDMARHAVVRRKVPTAVFSLEMSAEQIVQRLVSMEAHVNMHTVRSGTFDDYEFERIMDAFGPLSEAPLYIDDSSDLSTTELRVKARKLKNQADIGLVVVDYLQLMRGRDLQNRAQLNRVQEVSEISRGLKALARELKLPVVALSQMSRDFEKRDKENKKPRLSDLRESGSIEQDADLVIFLYTEEGEEARAGKDTIVVDVQKHRNGPTHALKLRFFKEQTRFGNMESYRQPEEQ